MSKEVSQSQKSLKRKSVDPTHGKAQRFLSIPLAKPPRVATGWFLAPHYWALNTFLQSFCSLPQGSQYPGLQLRTKLKNSFRRFLLRVRSQQKGGLPSLKPQGHLRLCRLSVAPWFCLFLPRLHPGGSRVIRAEAITFAAESSILCAQPQLIQ